MDKKLPPIRQRTLEFLQSRQWDQLPVDARLECQQQLSRLLAEVLNYERNDDERKDQ